MDHIRKALEKSQAEEPSTVRDWMKPVGGGAGTGSIMVPQTSPRQADLAESGGPLDEAWLETNHVIGARASNDPTVDRYRLLRTRLLQIMRPRKWNVIGITSPAPQSGKTLTSLNLAITMSKTENNRVIVVDADLRRPSVAQVLGLQCEKGMVDYLRGDAELASIWTSSSTFPNLTVLPGRPSNSLEHPSELLASPRFDALIKELRSVGGASTTIVVDTPPLYLGDDVLSAAPRLDCMLLILEEGISTSDDVEDSARLLSDYNLIGTVLNKSSEAPRKFESYYQSTGDDPA